MELPALQKRPEVRFWCRKASTGFYLVCELNSDKEEARFNSGIKVAKTSEWNSKKRILKDSALEEIRIRIVNDLNVIMSHLEFQHKPLYPSSIVALYKNKGKVPTLVDVYEQYIEERIKPKFERKKITYTAFRRYRYRLVALKKVLAKMGESHKLITQVGTSFCQRVEQELCKDKSGTTVSKHTRIFFNVMEFAHTLELIEKNPINSQTFTVKAENKSNIVYLTEKELGLWETTSFASKQLNEARDFFLFQCYTGMAYCDVVAFDYEKDVIEVEGIKRIATQRVKTDTDFCVPLLREAEEILKKYAYKLPFVRNDKLNARLKEIALIVGIELKITSHIGRKTFGYLMLNVHKIPIEIVSKMMGHKTIDMTLRFYAQHNQNTIIEATKHLIR